MTTAVRTTGCTRASCTEPAQARSLCHRHYQQAYAAGTLNEHPKLPSLDQDRKTCPPDHKHADSLVCYNLHKCRCTPCSRHRSETDTRRQKNHAYGRYDNGLVDAAPAREHMKMLNEYGIGYKRVAKLAGIGNTAARNIIWGRQDAGPRKGEMLKRIKRESAERILTVQPSLDLLAARVSVPVMPYVRMVKALVAMGWSQAKIADELGMTRANFDYIRRYDNTTHKKRVKMSASTARAIVALYEKWSMCSPPEVQWRDKIAANRARRHAAEHAWPTPMDWEAVDNDFARAAPVRRSAHERNRHEHT